VDAKPRRLLRLGWAIPLALSLHLVTGDAKSADLDVQRIERIDFQGNESIDSGALRKTMRLKQPVWWNPFRNTNYLGSDYLAVDLYRILDLYRDKGFSLASIRDARVRVPEDGQKVVLEIEIAEGPRYWLSGFEVDGVRQLHSKDIRRKIHLTVGKALSQSSIDAARGALEALYDEGGFLNALVQSDLILRGDSAAVVFRVREGPSYRFRSAIIDTAGGKLTRTDPSVVRREVVLKRGDTMRSSRILKTQERIFDTGIFRTVRVIPSVDTTGAALADLRITVNERKAGWYGFGAGYSSDDRAHLVVEWGDRNISGKARKLEANGDLAFSLKRNFGRHRLPVQSALGRLRYSEPWFLWGHTLNQVTASHTYEQFSTFDQDITEINEGIRRDIGRYSSAGLGITNKWVRTGELIIQGDTTRVRGNYVTRNVSSFIEEDRRDNLLDAKRGSYKQLLGEYAGGFLGGSSEFSRWNATGSWYRPVSGRLVTALRLRVGSIFPVGGGTNKNGEQPRVYRIPFAERFLLGGGTSVRGYTENSLGQTAANGQPIGGTAILLGNVELRFPIFWLLSGAVFLDGGNVWADPAEIKLSRFVDGLRPGEANPLNMSYAAGGGLRFLTPVGPFRVDYGTKLGSMRAGRKAGELYISLGQAF
jgi:outer membrane protein insertion porin family